MMKEMVDIGVIFGILIVIFGQRCLSSPTMKDDAVQFEEKIFTIYDGKRHYVQDFDQFLSCGYDPGEVKAVTEEELMKFPKGLPILRCSPDLPPVIKSANGSHCYIVHNNLRHIIPSLGAFLYAGYSTDSIVILSDDEVESIPLGDPHTSEGCACLDQEMEESCKNGMQYLQSLSDSLPQDLMCACVCPRYLTMHYPLIQPIHLDHQHRQQRIMLECVINHPNLTESGVVFGRFGEDMTLPSTKVATQLLENKTPFLSHAWRSPWPDSVIAVPDFHSIRTDNFIQFTQAFDEYTQLTPYSSRIPKLFWRGSATTPQWGAAVNPRTIMCVEAKKSPHIDAGIIQTFSDEGLEFCTKEGILKDFAIELHWAQYRGIISIDGTLNPWGLRWQLSTGAVVFKVDSNWTNEYVKEMVPWVHYIPLKDDFSDLVYLARLVTLEPGQAMEAYGRKITLKALEGIAINARDLMRRFTWEEDVNRIATALSDIWKRAKVSGGNATSTKGSGP